MKQITLRALALAFGVLSLFFAWYTARLIWVNVMVAGVAQHRQMGMYIGAVAFPAAALVFGYAARRCWLGARIGRG